MAAHRQTPARVPFRDTAPCSLLPCFDDTPGKLHAFSVATSRPNPTFLRRRPIPKRQKNHLRYLCHGNHRNTLGRLFCALAQPMPRCLWPIAQCRDVPIGLRLAGLWRIFQRRLLFTRRLGFYLSLPASVTHTSLPNRSTSKCGSTAKMGAVDVRNVAPKSQDRPLSNTRPTSMIPNPAIPNKPHV